MKRLIAFDVLTGTAATLLTFLFGGWHNSFGVLAALIALDYITGFAAAYLQGKSGEGGLSSRVGFKGILKKLLMVVMVVLAHLMDLMLGDTDALRTLVVFSLIANEALSITENLDRAGLPIPEALKKGIASIKAKGGSDKNPNS